MVFDFDLTTQCNHVVDGVQYWGFDLVTTEQSYFLNNDPTFRQKFLMQMMYDICPRCNGRGWYWDINITKNASTPNALSNPILIRGRALLKQEVTKFLTTIIGDNYFHPLYGIGYQSYIGTKILPETQEMLKIITVTGMDYYRSLQFQQQTYQTLDPAEKINSITNLDVMYDVTTSPSSFYISATITTESDEYVDINYVVSLEPSLGTKTVTSDVVSMVITE